MKRKNSGDIGLNIDSKKFDDSKVNFILNRLHSEEDKNLFLTSLNNPDLVENLFDQSEERTKIIIMGLAFGDHTELLDRFLSQNEEEVNGALRIAAFTNNSELLYNVFNKYPEYASVLTELRWAAIGNNYDLVKELLSECDDNSNNESRGVYVNAAVEGAALGNNQKLLEKLLRKHPYADVNSAIKKAAKANHRILLDKLLKFPGAKADLAIEASINNQQCDLILHLIKEYRNSINRYSDTWIKMGTFLQKYQFMCVNFFILNNDLFKHYAYDYALPMDIILKTSSVKARIYQFKFDNPSLPVSIEDLFILDTEQNYMESKKMTNLGSLAAFIYQYKERSKVLDADKNLKNIILIPSQVWYNIGRYVAQYPEAGQNCPTLSISMTKKIIEYWQNKIFDTLNNNDVSISQI